MAAKKPVKKVNPVPDKPKLKPDEFIFDTKITDLESCLEACMEELIDLQEYRVPDGVQKNRIKELTYWLCVWENQLPEAKRRGMTSVPTCIIERSVLGLHKNKGK